MPTIATAGHVDHGKSSLVRALTGTDPDRLAEEKRRGLTIDLGFAHITLAQGNTLSFIDVPGHIDFIRTMISGVSGVDLVLLTIDAFEGWKPQTQEHLGIIEVLGISTGIVALTKVDKLTPEELEHRITEIGQRLQHSSVDWKNIIPTSVITMTGIQELSDALSLLVSTRELKDNARTRLFIDRVFTMKGAGTVVTGTLEGAPIFPNDELVISRTDQVVRVREIQTHGQVVQSGLAGSRCAINLTGTNPHELERGDALIVKDQWWKTTTCDARLTVLASASRPLTKRGGFTLHIGSHHQNARVRVLHDQHIQPSETGLIRLRFSNPLPLVPGDRFLLRDTGTNETVGGGIILDVDPMLRPSRAQPDGTLERFLKERQWVSVVDAQKLTGLVLTPTIGQWITSPDQLSRCRDRLMMMLHDSVDMISLKPYERDVLTSIEGVIVEHGVARLSALDPLLTHPYVEMFRQAGYVTPDTSTLDRNVIRQLINVGELVEHDSIAFHRQTLSNTRPHLSLLWESHPQGFTMSQLREHLGISRKYAVPLATCLDKVGITKRSGDIRIMGSKFKTH